MRRETRDVGLVPRPEVPRPVSKNRTLKSKYLTS